MGTGNNEVQCQGNTRGCTCYRATGVRSDTVMASRIDGPSHKWAIQSVTSHDTVPIGGHVTLPQDRLPLRGAVPLRHPLNGPLCKPYLCLYKHPILHVRTLALLPQELMPLLPLHVRSLSLGPNTTAATEDAEYQMGGGGALETRGRSMQPGMHP